MIFQPEKNEQSGKPKGLIVMATLILSAICLTLAFLVGRQVRRYYRKRDGPSLNIQGFRDEDIAVSPNGSMLFPAFGPTDSFNKKGRRRTNRNRSSRFT